jgi:acyl phosphate:glycerol-3-phosphate acyltransferase
LLRRRDLLLGWSFRGIVPVTVDTLAAPLLSLLLGYILGSIPFGVLLTRLSGGGDLRSIGSGNIGATNVLRTGRKGLAALTLLLDGAKGAVAVLLVRVLFPGHEHMAALAALVGHLYPVWLGFRGGKGVATLFGVMAALHWPSAVFYAATWLGMLALTRFSSIAGITAALIAPVAAAAFGRFELALLYLGFALLIFWKHRANLERLMAGTEPRVGGTRDA